MNLKIRSHFIFFTNIYIIFGKCEYTDTHIISFTLVSIIDIYNIYILVVSIIVSGNNSVVYLLANISKNYCTCLSVISVEKKLSF